MSFWTHISAAIVVDTFAEEKDLKTYMEKLFEAAPKITGSERNADVFINVLSGHNTSNSPDCDHCEYKDTIEYYQNGAFQCKSPDDFECPDGEYQTRAVITIAGSLRDRRKVQTEKEWRKFIKYITSGTKLDWDVDNISCNIQGW